MLNSYLKTKFNDFIFPVVLFGCIWGIVEATLGYILHQFSVNIGWALWYPIAYLFMTKVYEITKKTSSVLYIALIAAAFKSLNLFLPVRIDKVINPIVAIITEGVSLFFLLKLIKVNTRLKLILTSNSLWRLFYLVYILEMPPAFKELSVVSNIETLLRFLITELIITSIVILILIALKEFFDNKITSGIKEYFRLKKEFEKQSLIIHNTTEAVEYKIVKKREKLFSENKLTVFHILTLFLLISANVFIHIFI
jgi:hypothetical protein